MSVEMRFKKSFERIHCLCLRQDVPEPRGPDRRERDRLNDSLQERTRLSFPVEVASIKTKSVLAAAFHCAAPTSRPLPLHHASHYPSHINTPPLSFGLRSSVNNVQDIRRAMTSPVSHGAKRGVCVRLLKRRSVITLQSQHLSSVKASQAYI